MTSYDDERDETLSFLEEIEKTFRDMIVGIFRFVFIRLPTWFYELFQNFFIWLAQFIQFTIKFSIRLARVLFFASIWGLLVLGPLAAALLWTAPESGLCKALGVAWAGVGIIGSVWGVRRWRQKRKGRYASSTSPRPPALGAEADIPTLTPAAPTYPSWAFVFVWLLIVLAVGWWFALSIPQSRKAEIVEPPIRAPLTAQRAMLSVLEQDQALGRRGTPNWQIAASMRAINLKGCPAAFQQAFRNHIWAWEARDSAWIKSSYAEVKRIAREHGVDIRPFDDKAGSRKDGF